MGQGKLSVVIPTMNEEKSIGLVIEDVRRAVGNSRPLEIIVVDTESKDRTREIASERGAIVVDEPRRGYGRAYKTGFDKASGDFIATLDADMTYPASDIPQMIERLERENLDFITTNRFANMTKGAMGAKHRLGNWILSVATRILFRVRIKDSQSGMWVLRKACLGRLRVESDQMSFSEEIKIEAFKNLKAAEVPISYGVRVGDVKLQSWNDGFGNLKYLFRKRF